jgi:hypothetical protein
MFFPPISLCAWLCASVSRVARRRVGRHICFQNKGSPPERPYASQDAKDLPERATALATRGREDAARRAVRDEIAAVLVGPRRKGVCARAAADLLGHSLLLVLDLVVDRLGLERLLRGGVAKGDGRRLLALTTSATVPGKAVAGVSAAKNERARLARAAWRCVEARGRATRHDVAAVLVRARRVLVGGHGLGGACRAAAKDQRSCVVVAERERGGGG